MIFFRFIQDLKMFHFVVKIFQNWLNRIFKLQSVFKTSWKISYFQFSCPKYFSNFYKHSNFCLWVIGYDTLFEKSNFCPKIQFWQNSNFFTSFSPKFFFNNFSREIIVVHSQKAQNHNIFTGFSTQKKSTIFLGNQSWIFGQKMKISNSDPQSSNFFLLTPGHKIGNLR